MSRNSSWPGKFTGISLTCSFFSFCSAITFCSLHQNSRTLREPKCRCGEKGVVDCGSKSVGADLGFSNVPTWDESEQGSASLDRATISPPQIGLLVAEIPILRERGRQNLVRDP